MKFRFDLAAPIVSSVLLAACGSSPLSLEDGCQPLLAGADCLVPYPSDFFRVEDASMPSGYRIELRGSAKLLDKDGKSADLTDWRPMDGYSRTPIIVTALGRPLSTANLAGIFDPPEDSMSIERASTLIVNADTGDLVPHFADVDPYGDGLDRQGLVLHPLVRLAERSRYVVAVSGVTDSAERVVPAPEGFRRIRDREIDRDPELRALSGRYEESIFPVLEARGLSRDRLQLAWDFTTGTDEHVEHDMLHIRQQTLEYLRANPPAVEIDGVEEAADDASGLWRTVHGRVVGPLFLDSSEPGASLVYGTDGEVAVQGATSIPFVAIIPASVRDAYAPARILAFGHGFFGRGQDVTGEATVEIAAKLRAVMVSIDWWGMSAPDRELVVNAIVTKPSHVLAFTDRLHQAMANWITMSEAMKSTLQLSSAFRRPADPAAPGVARSPDGSRTNAGEAIYDSSRVDYLGISLGHILGGVEAALNPTFERIVLHVGGAGFTHMMYRSFQFVDFLKVIDLRITDALDRQKYIATVQRHFDRSDPAEYAHLVLDEKLPGSPEDRQVLLQTGLGDTQVPNFTSFLHARLLGIGVTMPSPANIWGVAAVEAPIAGSAQTVFDFGLDTSFSSAPLPQEEDNIVHGAVRKLDAAIRQMDLFLRPGGKIVHPCDGPCDPD